MSVNWDSILPLVPGIINAVEGMIRIVRLLMKKPRKGPVKKTEKPPERCSRTSRRRKK